MATVFISYIHEEVNVASAVQRLIQHKLDKSDVFLSSDQWQVYAGEDWLAKITKELKSAKIVILMLSAKSVARPWVNFEAGGAWLSEKVVIPVCFNGKTRDSLPKPYSGIQALNLQNEWYYLITSIAHHLNRLPPPPFGSEDEDVRVLFNALDELE